MADDKIYGIKDNKSKVEVLSKTDADKKFEEVNKNFNEKIGAIDTLLDTINGEVI